MKTLTYSEARANFAAALDDAAAGHATLITRKRGDAAVIVSAAEYNGLKETAYLLSTPANRVRLQEALGGVKAPARTHAAIAAATARGVKMTVDGKTLAEAAVAVGVSTAAISKARKKLGLASKYGPQQ